MTKKTESILEKEISDHSVRYACIIGIITCLFIVTMILNTNINRCEHELNQSNIELTKYKDIFFQMLLTVDNINLFCIGEGHKSGYMYYSTEYNIICEDEDEYTTRYPIELVQSKITTEIIGISMEQTLR